MTDTLTIARPRDLRLPTYLGLQLIIMAACIFLLQLDPPRPPAQYQVLSAELRQDEAVWLAIALPHRHQRTRTDAPPFIYRMSFERAPTEASQPWAIFLPRFTSGVEVAVNGATILDSRLNPTAGRVDRNIPAIAPIPSALLRDGPNEITLRLFVWGPLTGYLDTIYVGPDTELRSSYDKRMLLFQTIPLILAAWQGTVGAILGFIWLSRRHEHAYGWLAAAMAVGVIQQFIPFPTHQILHGFLGASVPLESALVLHFAARFTGLKVSRLGWFVFLPSLIILAASAIGDPEVVRTTYMLLGPASIGVFVVLTAVILGWSALFRSERSSFFLGSTLTAVLVFWVHDALTVLDALPGERIFLGRLSYSVVLIAIGIGLTLRVVQALNQADDFAGRLFRQVRDAEEKLRASFAREEERSRKEALAAERTRLMRDLHDGLGGQLVSIVALAEQQHGGSATVIGDAARAALKDLRLVIDAMEEIDGDLMLVLGSWRERISAQLRAHSIQLEWQVLTPGGLPIFPGLRPWHVIQVIRLLDEAVTNAVKHSGAKKLRVIIETIHDVPEEASGRISVEDDGSGFDLCIPRVAASPAHPRTGRGLLNMKRRAELCGALLTISSGQQGTRVSLILPSHFGTTPSADDRDGAAGERH